ncbi:MAG: PorV/PorQ family protein [Chitinispirillales bacterium]|jgi:hypothetical protein|nr:PorV/PorQ family protein [Chitinispirillales bacterium]
MKNCQKKYRTGGVKAAIAAGLCLLLFSEAGAVGQAAVVTLGFPVGARATAMGEAFTGLANDASAIFYNPAGLGQSPLTLSWKTHIPDSAFTAVAAHSSTAFGARNYVWAGSGSGLARFNGKIWERNEIYLPGDDEPLRSIAQRYFETDDRDIINDAIWEIRKTNRLGMRRYERLIALLEQHIEAFSSVTPAFSPESYAKMLMFLPPNEVASSHIGSQILPQTIDAEIRSQIADEIVFALASEDRGVHSITELSIPFTIAVRDTVTALALDPSERLWVGTVSGLWRYHNNRWQRFTTENGLPSNRITAISTAPNGNVAVATETGLAVMRNLEWSYFSSENGLPDSYITSVAFTGNERLYVGTYQGLATISGPNNEIAIFDTTSGLLSLGVSALFADSKNRLWIGGENGITIYSGMSWRRYRFPGSFVYSFAEQANGTIWIGTNRGVITHRSGKDDEPEWKTYHSKNALRNDEVRALAACGKDMWIATDAAMHQYAHAGPQVMLFYEQLLPAFKMTELWHGFPAVVIPTEDWGTFGFSLNFINMGDHEQWDELEAYLGESRAWEGVFGISYGFPVREDLSLGINAKYVYSVLDQASGGVGQTFAIDAGILKRNFLTNNLDIGFMIQNMGPKIYYMTPEEADPIPFALRLGLAYRPVQTPFHELTLVFDAYREIVKNYFDKGPDPFWVALWTGMLNNKDTSPAEEFQAINLSTGLEYMYADFMALRSGFLFDYLGERFELSVGLGIKYANMNFDFSYIHAPPGFMGNLLRRMDPEKDGASGARDGQWRLSFLINL